jgi:amino acid permease
MRIREKHSNEEIKARIVMIVAVGLTLSFVGSVFTILYGLLFVSQPEKMAELDAQQINILSSMLLTLSGGLIGLLAGNGLKDKPKDPPAP